MSERRCRRGTRLDKRCRRRPLPNVRASEAWTVNCLETPRLGELWERDGERRLVQYVHSDGHPALVSFAFTDRNQRTGTACWTLRSWNDWAADAVCICEGFR